MIEIHNAIIKSVSLSTADYGCLSAWLHLELPGNISQGFGGYRLYSPKMEPTNAAGIWIWKCLEVVDVTEWSQLPGCTIRAEHDLSKVYRIGHILKDIWFDPKMEFSK